MDYHEYARKHPTFPVVREKLPVREVDASDVLQCLRVVHTLLESKVKLVEQSEANRRARICMQCPQRSQLVGCLTCRLALAGVRKLMGRQTPYDWGLDGCGVCGCSLKLAVWIDLKAQQDSVPAEKRGRFPSGCWKKLVD